MRIQSYQNMESEYKTENGGLEVDVLAERKKMIEKNKYSVIVEGEHNEFDNLEKWIRQNLNEHGLETIYYGKTGYDYGFAEYFANEKEHQEKLKFIIPNIFTVYPDAIPSRLIRKSDGYDLTVEYDSSDRNAIVFSAD